MYGVNVNKFPDHCCETLLVRLNSFSGADRQGPDYDTERQRFESRLGRPHLHGPK